MASTTKKPAKKAPAKKKAPTKAEKLFPKVLEYIEEGNSVKDSCTLAGIDKSNFFRFMNNIKDKEKKEQIRDQYARACEERAEKEFEEIIKIADGEEVRNEKGELIPDSKDRIARDRLRIDARKWRVSKMDPKKFGDKVDLDVTSGGDKLSISLDLGSDDD